ncbi:hypothetical protein NE237_021230 [Protea cynaroides]|uniref:H15 domain-containing protein n=1 Tax=Protea cynaroides TaxID=273540 RepID=A0A9Q0H8Q9_9MAGN|nr:hypothetical protein NE237_021230 [Protea cynaroides]
MATEEVKKQLPSLPEMILAAITALNEQTGSSKTAIAKYIESQHGDLLGGPSTLLTQHLNRMKDNGELIMVKNNYLLPSPDNPPKRGRGRPPKPKAPLPAGHVPEVSLPSRPRGRPPKPRDPNAVVEPKVSSGRPRGRPPKMAKVGEPATAKITGPPKPRGRPPKERDA